MLFQFFFFTFPITNLLFSHQYFCTQEPLAGLFISYQKLLRHTFPNSAPQKSLLHKKSLPRLAATAASAPKSLRYTASFETLATPSKRATQLQAPSPFRTTRTSFLPTPNSSNQLRARENSSLEKLDQVFPAISHNHQNASTSEPIGLECDSMGNPGHDKNDQKQMDSSTLEQDQQQTLDQIHKQANSFKTPDLCSNPVPPTKNDSSDKHVETNGCQIPLNGAGDEYYRTAISDAVARAVSQTKTEAQQEILQLRRQIEESRLLLQNRDTQLNEQMKMFKDLESSMANLQPVSENKQADTKDSTNQALFIEQLEQRHKAEIESILAERDRKIQTMKTQFDEKRNEFRKTIDALQEDLHDSNSVYLREVGILRLKQAEAEKMTERVKELEAMLMDLDVEQTAIQLTKEESKAQLQRLAESENKLLEKDATIKQLRDQLDDFKYEKETCPGSKQDSFADNKYTASEFDLLKKKTQGLERDKERLEKEVETERKKKEQAERELSNTESILEDKIFKESQLNRELSKLRQKTLKLEKELSGKHSKGELNEFIATGVGRGRSSPVPPSFLSRKTSVSGNGLNHSRENSHHKRFSLTGANTDSNPGSVANSPSTPEIDSLLEELPISSPDIGNQLLPLKKSLGNGAVYGLKGAVMGGSEGYIVKTSNNDMKAYVAGTAHDMASNTKGTNMPSTSSLNTESVSALGPPPFGPLPSFNGSRSSSLPNNAASIKTTNSEMGVEYKQNMRKPQDQDKFPTRSVKIRKERLSVLEDNKDEEDFNGLDDYDALLDSSFIGTQLGNSFSTHTETLNNSDKKNNSVSRKKEDGLVCEKDKPSSPEKKKVDEENIPEKESQPTVKKPLDLADGRKKWCGLCERAGHDSLECPFENDDLDF